VIALNHSLGIVGSDPQRVVVAVRSANSGEGAAAVDGPEHSDIEGVQGVGALRVGEDMRVIPSALAQNVLLIDPGPVAAGRLRTEDAAVGGFDNGPDALRVNGRYRHANASQHAAGQAGAA